MRLFYTVGSPFARIVRIALLETGLDARVTKQEVIRQRIYSVESKVLAFNPVGRVPTFELDDGTILTENKLILDYIDALNPGPKLLPRDGSDGWRTLAEMGPGPAGRHSDLDPCAGSAGTATRRGGDRTRPSGSTERRTRWRARLPAAPMPSG